VPADALAVHGLTAEFLADKPLFADLGDEFLTFVGDASVVAHNAGFDSRHIKDSLYSISRNTSASSPLRDGNDPGERPLSSLRK
jgi:DNA polymerase III subunit epsilon